MYRILPIGSGWGCHPTSEEFNRLHNFFLHLKNMCKKEETTQMLKYKIPSSEMNKIF